MNGNVLTLSRDIGLATIQHYRVTVQGSTFSGTFWNEGRYPDAGSFTGRLDAGRVDKDSARLPSLLGTWSWTCCRGRHSNTFTITEQRADGTIRGIFGDRDGMSSPLQGTYKDGVMQFTRYLDIGGRRETQTWRGRIRVQGKVIETVEGRRSGFAATADNDDFHARLIMGQGTSNLGASNLARGEPAIVGFEWLGMDEDRVGEWNGKPNGTWDGHFRLTLDAPGRFALASLSVWSAKEKGEKAGGQVWHSKTSSYWMLGVFRDGCQLNASHVTGLGEFPGRVSLDLYANSSGWFNPGQWFLLEMVTADGKILRQSIRLISVATGHGSIVAAPVGRDYTGHDSPQTSQPAPGKAELLFEVGNIVAVANGPNRPTTFTLAQPHRITLIRDYHWNSARGAKPGTIALRDAGGRLWGPWQATGSPGQPRPGRCAQCLLDGLSERHPAGRYL